MDPCQRALQRGPSMLCRACGYPVPPQPTGECPECGARLHAGNVRPAITKRTTPPLLEGVTAVICACIVLFWPPNGQSGQGASPVVATRAMVYSSVGIWIFIIAGLIVGCGGVWRGTLTNRLLSSTGLVILLIITGDLVINRRVWPLWRFG